MEGQLISLYQAKLVEGPSGPRESVPGRLGVFSYSGAGTPGNLCLFVPDDPILLGGMQKLRPGLGDVRQDGLILRYSLSHAGNKSYAWEIGDLITNQDEMREFIDYAKKNDRIIRHLMEGARLLGE